MFIDHFIIKNLKQTLLPILAIVSLCVSNIAYADTDIRTNIPTAQSIAELIEKKSLVEHNNTDELLTPKTVSEGITQLIETIQQGNEIRYLEALSLLEVLADETQNRNGLKIVKIYREYTNLNDFTVTSSNYDAKLNYFESILDSNNWFVDFHIHRLQALEHMYARKNDLALQTAQKALALIPNDRSEEAVNARMMALELNATLQNLMFNKELALINTKQFIDLKLSQGHTVDGIELLNNLMFSHSAWRDDEARLSLAQTLKRLENKYGSTTPGLSSHHIARVYNDIGEYEKAKQAALDTLTTANLDSLLRMARINLATAHAGLGETEDAKAILNNLPDDRYGRGTIPYARTLIALNEGRTEEALRLMNERYDTRVRSFLEEKSKNTADILATLSNSSERQAEREEALQREAYLVQSRLEQQEKINTLLIGLLSLIGLVGLASIIFARHRDKLAKELSVKSKEAASADKMKTEFLGMMSHELRTPLNGIIGLADVMAQTGPTDQVRERSEIILNSGNELFNVIEGIIDMSRIEGDKLELVTEPASIQDITQGLCEKWEEHAAEKPISFTYYITKKNSGLFSIDPLHVEQCINTLLSNAMKFTDHGKVHLHLICEDTPDEEAQTFSVIVADTGQGMSQTVQDKLFTPFLQADISMTRKHGGSGLRLAIARATARMMGGDITVNSREGAGSEFIFTFKASPSHIESPSIGTENFELHQNIQPAIFQETTEAHAIESDAIAKNNEVKRATEVTLSDDRDIQLQASTNALSHSSILIINENDGQESIAQTVLEPLSANCVVAETYETGLRHLAIQKFDCLVLDIEALNSQTIERLHDIRHSEAIWANIPILTLTQKTNAENNAACLAAGTNAVLAKPITSAELVNSIEYLCTQFETQPQVSQNFIERRRA